MQADHMWLASVWPFVFQTAKKTSAGGKQSATADAEIGFPQVSRLSLMLSHVFFFFILLWRKYNLVFAVGNKFL